MSQDDANALIAMEKHSAADKPLRLPDTGGALTVPLLSADRREHFFLDLRRNRLNLAKGTLQNRARTVFILARIDFGGAPHRNPDGEEIGCPHLHEYREGYGDRWARAVPHETFTNTQDYWCLLNDFMRFCNITRAPNFQRGIFT
jgi:hypothetical protein